jgi:hypothetical protein
MNKVTESEYKGFPILEIPLGVNGNGRFSFGVSKALAILDHIVAIEDFAKKYKAEIEAKDIYKFGGEKDFLAYCKKHKLDDVKLKSQIKGV